LAHGLAICHGGFEHQPEYFVIKKVSGKECLYIDPKRFYNDFRSALGKLLKDIKKAQLTSDIHVNFTPLFLYVNINSSEFLYKYFRWFLLLFIDDKSKTKKIFIYTQNNIKS
jgi:hypothetical protein